MQYSFPWQKCDFEQLDKGLLSHEDAYIRWSDLRKCFTLSIRSHASYDGTHWMSVKKLSKEEIEEALKANIPFWMKEDKTKYDNL